MPSVVEIAKDKAIIIKNDLSAISTDYGSDDWINGRSRYVGGSESYALGAKILGEEPRYISEFILWCEKAGHKIARKNDLMTYGKNTEQVIRELSADIILRLIGKKVNIYESNFLFYDTNNPFIAANIDGLIKFNDGSIAGLEIKTRLPFSWKGSDLPKEYWSQCQHYMMVTGLDVFYVISEESSESARIVKNDYLLSMRDECAKNGKDFDLVRESMIFYNNNSDLFKFAVNIVFRDNAYIEKLKARIIEFWHENVVKNVRPTPLYIECEKPYLELFRDNEGVESLNLDINLLSVLEELEQAKGDKADAERRIESAKLKLEDAMAGAKYATVGSYSIEKKETTRTTLDSRMLKEKNPEIYQAFSKTNTISSLKITGGY